MMKPYDATEEAYKNGYRQGVNDLAERVKEKKFDLTDQNEDIFYAVEVETIDQIAKEMGCGE